MNMFLYHIINDCRIFFLNYMAQVDCLFILNRYNEIIRHAKSQYDAEIKKVMSHPNGSRSFWTLVKQIEVCVVGAKVVYFYIYCIFGNIIFCYLLKTHPKYNVVTLNVTKN
ncbi:unnamed protein product [Callosobruchus maculatus]|uniref:Uncharacterized protein n=1 Tax=Callosobruchus maculatus TaxID=64391 RepID=A0A653CFY0_CALMS|nr:unnamed protein product [Callosobruchus maculatus]